MQGMFVWIIHELRAIKGQFQLQVQEIIHWTEAIIRGSIIHNLKVAAYSFFGRFPISDRLNFKKMTFSILTSMIEVQYFILEWVALYSKD